MNLERPRAWFAIAATVVSILWVQCSSAQQYAPQTEAALDRAQKAIEAGKYAEAVKAFQEANKLEHGPCLACYIGQASAYVEIGDMRHADESADKAVSAAKTANEQSMAHATKGSVLMHFGSVDTKRLAAAESAFRQALSADDANVQARFELGVCLLKLKKDGEGLRELKAFVSGYPTSSLVRQAELLISNPRRAREWFAPEFSVSTLQGQTLSLHELAGKIVVLDFWATWCPPCRESLPEIKDLLKKYPREKLVVVSISADEKEAEWKNFVAKKGMDWPQVLDGDERMRNTFHVHAFPTYLVIDGEGVVRERIVGTDPQQSVAYRLRDTLKGMKELN
jgi:thiol-disulfide isomerase/thioredoxin